MTEQDILFSQELSSPQQAGHKAYSLAELERQGFAVPPFFCIPAATMERHGSNGEINSPDSSLLQAIEKAIETKFPKGTLFSVRSSALGEDSAEASFAGQLLTKLRVAREDIPKAVFDCWRSASCKNVLEYAAKKDISDSLLIMGVVVQQMVEAELSGVAFSANPRGLLNEAVVVCGVSTGDGVVEDRVPVTTYYYNRTDKLYYYETQKNAVPLPLDTLEEIISALESLEQISGYPVDIEFSYLNGTLYLLQKRPITALSATNPLIMDNSNIVESYPGISSPLTASFVNEVYYGVFRGLAMRCLPSKSVVEQFEGTLREMVGSVNGRIYYKISNWYVILKFLPFQKKIIPVWQKMLGVTTKQYDEEKNPVTPWQRLRTYIKVFRSAFGIPRKMRKLEEEFLQVKSFFNKSFSDTATNKELLSVYKEIESRLLKDWDITLINDMYTFVYTGLLEGYLNKKGAENPSKQTNEYITAVTNLESLKPITALTALAVKALEQPDVLEELYALKYYKDVRDYLIKGSNFAVSLQEYLEEYGDRSLEELKLESETFRTSPMLLVEQIRRYTKAPDKIIKTSSNLQNGSAEPSSSVKETWLLRYLQAGAKRGISNREISRLNRSRIFGMVREIFLKVGQNFTEVGKLSAPRDIFYLSMEEVFSAIENEKNEDFSAIINARKREYQNYEELPAYTRLVFSDKEFNTYSQGVQQASREEKSSLLQGTPCSNGLVEGEVLVVNNPTTVGDVSDKILVTKTTDPGWVFLLATAKGIIAEKGSLLSHTAIISRELKVPSVVGVKRVTEQLQDGDVVRLNGNTGEIEVLTYADGK